MRDFILQKSVQQAISNASKRTHNSSERTDAVHSSNPERLSTGSVLGAPTPPVVTATNCGSNTVVGATRGASHMIKSAVPSTTASGPPIIRPTSMSKHHRVKSGDYLPEESGGPPDGLDEAYHLDNTLHANNEASAGSNSSKHPTIGYQQKGRGRLISRGGGGRGQQGWVARSTSKNLSVGGCGGEAGDWSGFAPPDHAAASDSDSGGEWQQVGNAGSRQHPAFSAGVDSYNMVIGGSVHPPYHGASTPTDIASQHAHWRQRTKSGGSERHNCPNVAGASGGVSQQLPRRGGTVQHLQQRVQQNHQQSRNRTCSGGDEAQVGQRVGVQHRNQQQRRSRKVSHSTEQEPQLQEHVPVTLEDITNDSPVSSSGLRRPSSIGIEPAYLPEVIPLQMSAPLPQTTIPITLEHSHAPQAGSTAVVGHSVDVDKLTLSLQQLASTTDGVEVLEEVLKKLVFPVMQQRTGLTPSSDVSELFPGFDHLGLGLTSSPFTSTNDSFARPTPAPVIPSTDMQFVSAVQRQMSECGVTSPFMGSASSGVQSISGIVTTDSCLPLTASGPPGLEFPPMPQPLMMVEQPKWFYIDPKDNVHGPYDNEEMRHWLESGFFTDNLQLRRNCDPCFVPLSTYKKLYPNNSYFMDAPVHPPPLFHLSREPNPPTAPVQTQSPLPLAFPQSLHTGRHPASAAEMKFLLEQMSSPTSRLPVVSTTAGGRLLLEDSAIVGVVTGSSPSALAQHHHQQSVDMWIPEPEIVASNEEATSPVWSVPAAVTSVWSTSPTLSTVNAAPLGQVSSTDLSNSNNSPAFLQSEQQHWGAVHSTSLSLARVEERDHHLPLAEETAVALPQHARWADGGLTQAQTTGSTTTTGSVMTVRQLQDLELRQQEQQQQAAMQHRQQQNKSAVWRPPSAAPPPPTLAEIQSEQEALLALTLQQQQQQKLEETPSAQQRSTSAWSVGPTQIAGRSLQQIQAEELSQRQQNMVGRQQPVTVAPPTASMWASKVRQPTTLPVAGGQRSVLSIWSGAAAPAASKPVTKTPTPPELAASSNPPAPVAAAATASNKSKKQRAQQQATAPTILSQSTPDGGTSAAAAVGNDLDKLKHVMAQHQPVNPLVEWAKENVRQLPAACSNSFDIATLIEITSDLPEREEVFDIFAQYFGDSPAVRNFTSEFLDRRSALQRSGALSAAESSVKHNLTVSSSVAASTADKNMSSNQSERRNDLNWQTASRSGQSSKKKKKPQKNQIIKF